MVAENVQNIRRRIALACERSGRSSDEITLIAVTKDFSSDVIREIINAGIYDIGENYVQELKRKRDEIRENSIRWHFIGHLQTNKVKEIAPWIHAIHSVDSVHVGSEISKKATQSLRRIEVLVEVNTTGEATKFGLTPPEAPPVVKQLVAMSGLSVAGLMTIGPMTGDPESARKAFRSLRTLKDGLAKDGIILRHLSMGMSGDFEVAIEEGATMIRIGTAIAGRRNRRKQP